MHHREDDEDGEGDGQEVQEDRGDDLGEGAGADVQHDSDVADEKSF